jgi:hypothetical protein
LTVSNLTIKQPIALTSSFDSDLSRVRSFEKKQEIFNTLHSENPDHYSRLYLVGFLKSVGYSLDEICSIIDKEASWGNYDATMTYCHVRSIFKPGGKDNKTTTPISSRFLKEGAAPGNFLQKVSDSVPDIQYEPIYCQIGTTLITCYYKKCVSCNEALPILYSGGV